jgi:hypothetical protein
MSRFRLLGILTLVVACSSSAGPAEGDPVEGLLTVRWTGTHEGSFTAPASGRWCQSDSLIEIIAARADTGVGLVLLGQDSVREGQYPVFPSRVFIPTRPQANASVRWLGRDQVLGFVGKGGQLSLTETGERLTGRVEASLKLYQETATDTIRMIGEFTRIPVRTAAPPCGRLLKPTTRP